MRWPYARPRIFRQATNDTRRSQLVSGELESDMTNKRRAVPGGFVWFRVTATVVAWLLLVAFIHRLAHAYQSEIVEILNLPAFRIAATTLLVSALVYFIAISLPWVPNPGFRSVCMIFVWVALLVLGHSLSHMGFHDAQSMLFSMRESLGPASIVLLVIVYGVVLAMPFLPGVELGLLIMAVFGPAGALAAYVATLVGLILAYAVGRALPEQVVAKLLERIGVVVPRDGMVSGTLVNHRHLALAVCLNFPGNAALGGGGGVALLCGVSRQFSLRAFVLTLAIAISPVPILVLTGLLSTEPLMEHHGFLHDALTNIEGLFIHN